MFAELKTEYEARRAELKAKVQASRKELNRLAEPLSKHILAGLNSQVELLHHNQKRIEERARVYRKEAGKLNVQATKWMDLYDGLNGALKELGDIVNWAEIIEKEMQEVSSCVSKILTEF